jgi:hypothetical protein
MRLPGNKKLVAVVAGVVLLSGGAGAFAATQLSSNPRQAYLNDVARRLHVTPAALTSAMKQAMIDQINAAQKAGKLTAAQASAAESRIKSGHTIGGFGGPGGPGGPRPGFAHGAWRSGQGRLGCGGSSTTTTSTTTTSTTSTPCKGRPPQGFGRRFGQYGCSGQWNKTTTSTSTTSTSTTSTSRTSTTKKPCPSGPAFGPQMGPGQHMGGFGRHMGFGSGVGFGPGLFGLGEAAVIRYLDISAATLRSDLAAGKSLAKIASGISGKSASGLESALTAAGKTQLHKAVSAGWMTSAQAAKALSALSSLESKLIDRSFKFPAAGRFHSSRTP